MLFSTFGQNYYIDIDKVDKEVELKSVSGDSQIHLVKYELIKMLVDIVLTEDEIVDENLGMKSNEVSIPFKIAFNSLLVKKIINKL
jgi:hypothetical protein|tara:strand:- start:2613 stop:2870 length:258 start_codon:yes stop_codon:yes gene_type:complete